MCTVSFDKEALNITIHNLHPDLVLMSPVYFSNGATCHVFPSQQTNTGTTMEASFGIIFKQEDFKGALLHKLQRNYSTRTNNQSNSCTTFIKHTTTNVYLLIVWDVGDYFHNFYIRLIECDDDFILDEDKLLSLYWKYDYRLHVKYESDLITWLIHRDSVIKTRFSITYGSDYKLNIIIFEGTWIYNTEEPIKIDPKRLVLHYRYGLC
jgi:hypothetical protein